MAHRLGIAAATAASTALEFNVTAKQPMSILAVGDLAANTITFDIRTGTDASPVWNAYTKTTAVTLTNSNKSVVITEPGRYRVNKPITTNSVAIWLCNN